MTKWQVLRAGSFRLDGGSMFGVVPRALWAKLASPDPQNRIPLQTNCILIESEQEGAPFRILIETGYGDKWDDKSRSIFGLEKRTIVDALGEVDVTPEMIDLVVVTHLHFDHAGGLTHLDQNGDAVSTFPNAKIVVQEKELEDALANKSTMTKTYLRNHLDPVAKQIETVDGEVTLVEGDVDLRVFQVPGHTWGQQAVRFNGGNEVVCFPGDVMPTVNHVGLAFSMGYDMLPYDNMQSKKRLLEQAMKEKWLLVLDHEPENPVVRVCDDERGKAALYPVEDSI